MIKISSSLEDYIEAISEIIEENEHAHTKDIAKKLNVKMPSVTNALQNLKALGLIEYQSHTPVTLTPEGTRLGAMLRRRHYNIRMFFNQILQMELADADVLACKLEHVIGENISSRLAFLAENIMESPECEELRKIIDTQMASISSDNSAIPMLLADVADGDSCVISKIEESLKGIGRFADLGLVKGTLLTMEGRAPFGNLIRVKVMGASLSIRVQDAKHIWVKLVPEYQR
ncbi:MAG: metal-dependent transcriptional regulator [Lentisphaeria bacterium]|nr:metal-dependent transcriptional regulator [Lentisphaeria bacterium]